MPDQRLDRLADVLIRYSTRIKKGDLVSIAADPIAAPLVRATAKAVLLAGGHPFWVPRDERLDDIMYECAGDEQLTYMSPIDIHRIETIDVQIAFWAERNTRHLSQVDPKRIALREQSRRPWMTRFMQRTATGAMRWVGTQYPTDGAAQDAEMSLAQYEDFVFGAGLLHLPDPVAAWQRVHEKQERVRERLQLCKTVRFRTPPRDGHDGTDLTVSVDGSTWINCAGRENFPDGEVFAGPQGAEGHVNYTFPAVYRGREVEGVRLAFKGGRVIDASAKRGEDYLISMLDQDEGARVMGEIAVGTNYGIKRFTKNTLFDEKIGGTFHAAVGAGYPESGNSNQSGLHWDMVCDLRPGGTIEADGEVISKDGRFVNSAWPGEA